jgi:hypothetical protein
MTSAVEDFFNGFFFSTGHRNSGIDVFLFKYGRNFDMVMEAMGFSFYLHG